MLLQMGWFCFTLSYRLPAPGTRGPAESCSTWHQLAKSLSASSRVYCISGREKLEQQFYPHEWFKRGSFSSDKIGKKMGLLFSHKKVRQGFQPTHIITTIWPRNAGIVHARQHAVTEASIVRAI